jgi:hypothetical protein
MEFHMKRMLVLIALLIGLVASAGPVAAAPAEPPGQPGVIFEITLGTDVCAFPVHLVLSGKGKAVELPGDRTILPAPGQKVTFTHLDPVTGAAVKSVSYVITGATHQQTLANDDVLSTVTGRNTLVNGSGSVRPGIFLVVGTFHFTLDAAGNEVEVFNLDGPGQVTNVCALL